MHMSPTNESLLTAVHGSTLANANAVPYMIASLHIERLYMP